MKHLKSHTEMMAKCCLIAPDSPDDTEEMKVYRAVQVNEIQINIQNSKWDGSSLTLFKSNLCVGENVIKGTVLLA